MTRQNVIHHNVCMEEQFEKHLQRKVQSNMDKMTPKDKEELLKKYATLLKKC